jgi:hypothetical protein
MSKVAARFLVVDFQIFAVAAELATVAVAVQHPHA